MCGQASYNGQFTQRFDLVSVTTKILCLCVSYHFVFFTDILESEHEEAVYAATEAFKNILNSCVDWELISNGVSELRRNLNNEARTSPPTIIEKICATIESLLDYRFSAVWDLAFQVVSTCFNKLGNPLSLYILRLVQYYCNSSG